MSLGDIVKKAITGGEWFVAYREAGSAKYKWRVEPMSEKPIRILQVLTAMNRGGAETMLMNLYRAIDRDRIQFDFAVTTTKHCDYDDEIESLGGRIVHYPLYTGKNHFAYKKWWNDFFQSHPEYRIIHGHIGSTAAIYLKIAKKYGCYTIAHSHNTSGGFGLHRILYEAYSYSTRHIADFFIGCSTEALIARYGKVVADNKNISIVLPNGIDVSKYAFSGNVHDEVRKEMRIKKDALVVGTVGRLTPQKNPMFILDILGELQKVIKDFVFLWVGTGEMKDEIEAGIRERGLQDNILLLGVRDDIPRVLQAMNVFILPSKFEGLPVVGVETQAAGVPFLCSDRVSSEINMTKCCKMLSIDTLGPWVDGILMERKFRRVTDAMDDVISAGYDIHATVAWLTEFYTKNWS